MAWHDIMYAIKSKRNLSFARESLKSESPRPLYALGRDGLGGGHPARVGR